MDPITGISLVSGIISFVSFGKDLVKGAIKIHASQDGYSQENQNREFVADELRRFSVSLQPPGESGLAGEEKALASLAAKCHELAEDMAKVLDKIKAKDPNSKMQTVWAALKATAHEKDLMDFERRLDQCATQMHLQLTFFTRFVSFYSNHCLPLPLVTLTLSFDVQSTYGGYLGSSHCLS